jgi:hypothetical protein
MMEELDAAADAEAMKAIIEGRRQALTLKQHTDNVETQRGKMMHEANQAGLQRTHEATTQALDHQHEEDLSAMPTGLGE